MSTIKENVGFVSCPYSILFLCWLALFRRNGHKIACKARKKQVPRNIAVVKQCSGQVTRNKLLMSSREELIWPLLLGFLEVFLPFLLLCGHTQCMAPKVLRVCTVQFLTTRSQIKNTLCLLFGSPGSTFLYYIYERITSIRNLRVLV